VIAIRVNGATRELTEDATVTSLLATLGRDDRGVAVAVNETVVPRRVWSSTILQAGDRVEVLRAARGGC
jgi:sulfur carrier protein